MEQSGGNANPDPWFGWDGAGHLNSPSGGGGPGKFRVAGPLGTGAHLGAWRGAPHPLAPAARYLAVNGTDNIPSAAADCTESPAKPSIEEKDGAFFVSLPGSAQMRTFMRTKYWRFASSVKDFAKASRLAVVINGNMYRGGGAPIGIVRGRGQALGGTSEPDRFHVSWSEGPLGGYSFALGDPPAAGESAVGGLGPLIMDGMKYGPTNVYRLGVPAGAALTGPPDPKHKPFLEVRSSAAYAAFAERGPSVGKVIIGFGKGALPLRIVVQPDGVSGLTIDSIRDQLHDDGVTHAAFLDGSDSALLYANDRFYVQQGAAKNWTNCVGIGFQLPTCGV